MTDWILWYLIVTAAGWLAFPIAYRLLPKLKDRGFAIARSLGLLLWGYLFWLPAALGIAPNRMDGALLGAGLLAGLSALAVCSLGRNGLRRMAAWLRSQGRMIIAVEALFILAFAGWALVRAANPEAVGTEKPMELAFINAILSSPGFPPHDPWLSGYAISYYYFGYVLLALPARLAGTSGGVTFNLGISLVFALSALGAYGLAYNLLNSRRLRSSDLESDPAAAPSPPRYLGAALLAPLMTLIASNLEGFLHLLHHNGLFWRQAASGALTSPFWTWLDIKDLNQPPVLPPAGWAPDRFWWWWRASRVIQDYDLAGNAKEIINEFPFFSYLLADVHPHVLAMPFAFLAIALALNLLLGDGRGVSGWPRLHLDALRLTGPALLALPLGAALIGMGAFRLSRAAAAASAPLDGAQTATGGLLAAENGALTGLMLALLGLVVVGAAAWVLTRRDASPSSEASPDALSEGEQELEGAAWNLSLAVHPAFLLLSMVALGGMAFLNTWDFPVYVALAAAAYALGGNRDRRGDPASALIDFLALGIVLGIGGIMLYLPFYLGFSSQAGGLIPNLVYPTRGAQLWVMFAPLLAPILAFAYHLALGGRRKDLLTGFILAGGMALGLWALALLYAALIARLPEAGALYLGSVGASDAGALLRQGLLRRLASPGGWLTLVALLAPVLGLLAGLLRRGVLDRRELAPTGDGGDPAASQAADVFALLLILLGGLLVLAPEFFFLRDLFGWRMNTIFKFYYQAWLLWSAAAAYAVVVLLKRLSGWRRAAFGSVTALLLAAALVYPVLSLDNKTNGWKPATWTLDSVEHLKRSAPDEIAAVEWLKNQPYGVIAEGVPGSGGSYTEFARSATLSGKPGVLGWVGHENQWRGDLSSESIGTRQADLERLYCTRSWTEAREILNRYNVRYVIVGPLERAAYPPGEEECVSGVAEAKFQRILPPGFQSGAVTIYIHTNDENE